MRFISGRKNTCISNCYRLLKGTAAQDTTYKRRYELMFVALINVAGDPLYQEFRKQEVLVKILTTTGEKVQEARDKDVSTYSFGFVTY